MRELIEKYLIDNNIPVSTKKESKSYVDAIIYSAEKAGISQDTLNRFAKKYFSDKPKWVRLKTWILGLHNLKHCSSCAQILSIENFGHNITNNDSLQYMCKKCIYESIKVTKNAIEAKRRASKINRTPEWADLEAISKFYSRCPSGYHVDHIIPLQGKNVSGLHVLSNLQYLTATENLSKHNKFEI